MVKLLQLSGKMLKLKEEEQEVTFSSTIVTKIFLVDFIITNIVHATFVTFRPL